MSDDGLTVAVLRASFLGGDALTAMMDKAGGEIASLSDTLTREVYAFLNGFLSALVTTGSADAEALLDMLRPEGAGSDSAKMRHAIAAVWGAISRSPLN